MLQILANLYVWVVALNVKVSLHLFLTAYKIYVNVSEEALDDHSISCFDNHHENTPM